MRADADHTVFQNNNMGGVATLKNNTNKGSDRNHNKNYTDHSINE